ncbi:MAG: hypothetical protein M1561_06090 [Gammaproteobacteria bacterium]|nr:hypothetical protein [Gammaproteobacteria bacterium]
MVSIRKDNKSSELKRFLNKINRDSKFRKMIQSRINDSKVNALRQILEDFGFKLTKNEFKEIL